jgi:phytoene synthase
LTIPQLSWERRLFDLALEPLQHNDPAVSIVADAETLARAYARCHAITKEHSKTFHLASGLLPPDKREAARALYAFCRVSDDLIDHPGDDPLASLEAWRTRALTEHPPADDPVALAWADTRVRYDVPVRYAHQLIDGVTKDLTIARYETFDDLAEYAYGVASTVGLLAMHIIGFDGPQAIPYAVKLGVALQLTNILRDVREDWDNGRLYLPQDELSAFGLSEEQIAQGRVDHRWQVFMRYQIDRNRRLYAEAMPGIAMLHRDGRFAIAAAAELYRAILDDIEAHEYDVFTRRAHVGKLGKLRRIPGIWWRTRTLS